MIKLVSLSVEGFKNLNIDHIDFPPEGNILITGKNESGKSSLFEAIFFALTSELLVKKKGYNDAIAFGKRRAVVDLVFEKNGRHARILKEIIRKDSLGNRTTMRTQFWPEYNTENNTSPQEGAGKPFQKKIIEPFLGFDKDILLSTSFVKQKGLEDFLDETKETRKMILAKLLNLEKISNIRDKYRKNLKNLEFRVSFYKLKNELKNNQLEYTKVSSHLEYLDALKQNVLNEFNKYNEILGDLNNLNEVNKKYEENIKERDKLNKNLKNLEEEKGELDKLFQRINRKRKIMEETQRTEEKIKEKRDKQKELQEKIELYKKKEKIYSANTEKLENLNELLEEIEEKLNKYEVYRVYFNETNKINNQIKELNNQKEILENKIKNHQKDIKKNKANIRERINNEIENLKKTKKDYLRLSEEYLAKGKSINQLTHIIELKKLQDKLEEEKKSLNIIQNKITEYKDREIKIREDKKKESEIQEELNQIGKEIEESKKELDNLKRNKEIEIAIEKIEKALIEKEDNKNKLNDLIDKKKKEFEEFEKQRNQIEFLKNAITEQDRNKVLFIKSLPAMVTLLMIILGLVLSFWNTNLIFIPIISGVFLPIIYFKNHIILYFKLKSFDYELYNKLKKDLETRLEELKNLDSEIKILKEKSIEKKNLQRGIIIKNNEFNKEEEYILKIRGLEDKKEELNREIGYIRRGIEENIKKNESIYESFGKKEEIEKDIDKDTETYRNKIKEIQASGNNIKQITDMMNVENKQGKSHEELLNEDKTQFKIIENDLFKTRENLINYIDTLHLQSYIENNDENILKIISTEELQLLNANKLESLIKEIDLINITERLKEDINKYLDKDDDWEGFINFFSKFEFIKDILKDIEESHEGKISDEHTLAQKKQEIDNNQQKIKNLVEKIPQNLSDKKVFDVQFEKLKRRESETQTSILHLKDFFKDPDNDWDTITNKKKKSIQNLDNITIEIDSLRNKLSEYRNRLNELKDTPSDGRETQNELNKKRNEIDYVKREIYSIDKKLRDLTRSKNELLLRYNIPTNDENIDVLKYITHKKIESEKKINEFINEWKDRSKIEFREIKLPQIEDSKDYNKILENIENHIKELETNKKILANSIKKNQINIEKQKNNKDFKKYMKSAQNIDNNEEDVQKIYERLKEEYNITQKAITILEKGRDYIIDKIIPKTEENLTKILPILTANRYKDIKINEDYQIKIFESKLHDYIEKNLFSGGTNDQIALAIRLAFALATLGESAKNKESFIFLDEPLGFFDDERKNSLIELLTQGIINEKFAQRFVISNFQNIKRFFDYIIELDNGRIIEEYNTETLDSKLQEFVPTHLQPNEYIIVENDAEKVKFNEDLTYFTNYLRIKNISGKQIRKLEINTRNENFHIVPRVLFRIAPDDEKTDIELNFNKAVLLNEPELIINLEIYEDNNDTKKTQIVKFKPLIK